MDISVIISNYNAERYLKQCIESLLCQQFAGEYEIIVVDDCSSDSSWRILTEIKDRRLLVQRSLKNEGASASRNKGLSIAKGSFICFTDSDDFVEKNYLSSLFTAINELSDLDMAVVPFYGYFQDTGEIKPEHEVEGVFRSEEMIERLMKFRLSNIVWNKIYKREIMLNNNIKFKEGICNEDILFNYQYLLSCRKIIITSNPVYYYRIHSASLTGGLYRPLLQDMIYIYNYIKDKSKEKYPHTQYLTKYFAIRLVMVIGIKRILKRWRHNKSDIPVMKAFVHREISFRDSFVEGLTIKERILIFFMKIISLF